MVEEVVAILKNTVNQLTVLYKQNTKAEFDQEYFKECLQVLSYLDTSDNLL
jgi:hypothetical protein